MEAMRRVSIPLGLVLAGCGGGTGGGIAFPRIVGLAPIDPDSAVTYARSTRPVDNREIRFKWQVRDDQGAAGGQGRVRLALPDSARLDVRGPLGSGRAAAFVSGDTALWAEPESDVKRLVPNYPLFWALLGVVRAPAEGAVVRRYLDRTVDFWQYQNGADTVDYIRVAGPPVKLYAEVRSAGKRIGTVQTTFGSDGLPVTSRLIVPSGPARLDVTFSSNLKAKSFAPDTWTPVKP